MNCILQEIKKLFIKFDPEKLIQFGDDDYDLEALALFEFLDKDPNYRFESFKNYWKSEFLSYSYNDYNSLREIFKESKRLIKDR